MPIMKKHFSLSPLNDVPVVMNGAAITGGFSHKDGFPTIRFSIPAQNTLLETTSLKLVGQILIKKADNTALNDQIVAGGPGGTTALNNGATMEAATAINIPNWGGMKNCIDKIVLQSKKTQVELTSAINYAQFESLGEVYSNNKDDYKIVPLNRSLNSGENSEYTNRRMLRSAPAGNAIASLGDKYVGQFFSIRLNLDLLNNVPLNLSQEFLGGCLITIHLAPDSNVLCNRHRAVDTAQQANARAAEGSNYVFKNLKLEGRYLVPDQQDIADQPENVMLSSRLNLINDVQSNINSNSYTPQLSLVKSVVNLYQDQDQPNNFAKNMNNFRQPVGAKANQQAKNGLRFPYDYKTEVKPNWDSQSVVNDAEADIVPSSLQFPTLSVGDAEVRKQFERAVLGGVEPYHSSATFEVQNASLVEDYAAAAAGANGVGNNMRPNCVGIGADYTFNMGGIQNFQNQDYNLQLESGVNTGNASLPASRSGGATPNPHLQQTFIKHMSPFNLKSLVKTM